MLKSIKNHHHHNSIALIECDNEGIYMSDVAMYQTYGRFYQIDIEKYFKD